MSDPTEPEMSPEFRAFMERAQRTQAAIDAAGFGPPGSEPPVPPVADQEPEGEEPDEGFSPPQDEWYLPEEVVQSALLAAGPSGLDALEFADAIGESATYTQGRITGTLSRFQEQEKIAKVPSIAWRHRGANGKPMGVYVHLDHVGGRRVSAYNKQYTSKRLDRLFGADNWIVYVDSGSDEYGKITRGYRAADLDAKETR